MRRRLPRTARRQSQADKRRSDRSIRNTSARRASHRRARCTRRPRTGRRTACSRRTALREPRTGSPHCLTDSAPHRRSNRRGNWSHCTVFRRRVSCTSDSNRPRRVGNSGRSFRSCRSSCSSAPAGIARSNRNSHSGRSARCTRRHHRRQCNFGSRTGFRTACSRRNSRRRCSKSRTACSMRPAGIGPCDRSNRSRTCTVWDRRTFDRDRARLGLGRRNPNRFRRRFRKPGRSCPLDRLCRRPGCFRAARRNIPTGMPRACTRSGNCKGTRCPTDRSRRPRPPYRRTSESPSGRCHWRRSTLGDRCESRMVRPRPNPCPNRRRSHLPRHRSAAPRRHSRRRSRRRRLPGCRRRQDPGPKSHCPRTRRRRP